MLSKQVENYRTVGLSERPDLLTLISPMGQWVVYDDKPYAECRVVKNQ